MWMVELDMADDGSCVVDIIHLDTIYHAAHLLPSFGADHIPKGITAANSLDLYHNYFLVTTPLLVRIPSPYLTTVSMAPAFATTGSCTPPTGLSHLHSHSWSPGDYYYLDVG